MKLHRPVLILCLSAAILFSLCISSFAENGNEEDAITFNFVDVEIPTIIKFISEITSYNFIFDERIKGNITIIAPTKLTVSESFSLFTSVLGLKGYTIIPAGPKTYKIIPSSLAKQEGLISEDDTRPVNEAYITKLLRTEHVKAEDTLQFLRPIVSRDGHISAFGPGNLLLVVDSAVNIEKVTSILKQIDRPAVEEEEAVINVYFLQHADATNLSEVLQGIIQDLQTAYKTAPGRKPPGRDGAPVLSVTPDKSTNSLIIVAPPTDYRNIAHVIKTLDRRRKQVFVEAMIVEASIDKLKELGSRWRVTARNNDEPIAIGGFGNISSSQVQSIITGLTGFSAGGMGNFLNIPVTTVSSSGTISTQTLTAPGFAALFSLNFFEDTINVLSTPQILTSDNEEAEILVGENVPFISARERDITTTNTVLSSIQRTDVGITLRITPQITEGDYVKLNIYQEISSVKDTTEEILTTVGPTTTKRSTKTSVSVKDGRTVVIGGLMQEEEQEGTAKTPILGDIPILGWFFKFKSVSRNKTNLLVFLSPHIVKEASQLSKITEDKHGEFVEREKFYSSGELLVKFRENVPREKALEIISYHKAKTINYFTDIKVYHIQLRPDQTVEEAVREFSAIPEVSYAEPNYRFKLPPEDEDVDAIQEEPDEEENDRNQPDESSLEAPAPAGPPATEKNTEEPVMTPEDNEEGRGQEPGMFYDDGTEPPHAALMVSPGTRNKPVSEETADPVQDTTESEAGTDPESLTAANDKPPETSRTRASDNAAVMKTSDKKTEHPEDEEADGQSKEAEAGPVPARHNTYYIQIGAWKNPEYAQEAIEKIRDDYPDSYMVRENSFNIVRIPGIHSRSQGLRMLKELRKKFRMSPFLAVSQQ